MKINVIIVEDEPIILNNIAKKIEQTSESISVVGKLECGRDALTFLKSHPADLIFTDIEMPGMNGIELIRAVKEQYPSIKIVILSGHNNFEYARTAIQFGVEDYLLKPIASEYLLPLMNKLCMEITAEKQQKKREIISLALSGNPLDNSTPNLFKEGTFYLFHITVGNTYSWNGLTVPKQECDNVWNKIDFYSCFRNTPELLHLWIIDEVMPMQKFIIIHINEQKRSAEHLNLILSDYLRSTLGTFPFLVLFYHTPIEYQEVWNTAKLLRESAKILSTPFLQRSYVISSMIQSQNVNVTALKENIHFLYGIGNMSQFLAYIKRILQEYLYLEYSSDTMFTFIRESFDALSACFQIDTSAAEVAGTQILSEFYAYSSLSELTKQIENAMQSLFQNSCRHISSESLSVRLKQYIESNYQQKLSLNDLSAHFCYTPSYIHRIFKKEFGVSPVQYITNLKMEHAKKLLLKDLNLDIKSIAASLGYEDSRYFSRVFKQETGMTPSLWIQQNHP